ncbi:MAG TPA: MEDS domain-containing protein [Candidatus Acidoferrum sp.]|nr:MEDS domain-containing protein [Candidatus Acidoferrum sp.]
MSISPTESRPSLRGRLRKAGQGHVVQFYTDDAFVTDGVAHLVAEALDAGDSAVVVVTPAHAEAIAQRLNAEAPLDFARALEERRYVSFDAATTLASIMDEDLPNEERFVDVIAGAVERARDAALSADRHVVAFGEMVVLLWQQGKREAAIRLEALWNQLARTHSFSLRCAYPIESFARQEDAQFFARVCAEHSAVIPEESYTALQTDEERLRAISRLQQRERALETETAAREKLARQVEEHKRVETQLSGLSARLMRTQDEERRSVARELHESIGQDLVALQMSLQSLESERHDAARAALIAEARETISRSIRELRLLSYVLHPPLLDELGLVAAISWYANGFSQRSGIRVGLDLPSDSLRLGNRTELTLFRVVQEALANVQRHSQSATAEILLAVTAEEALLEVIDRGKGFPQDILDRSCPRTEGLGLASMRSRLEDLGGRLEIETDGAGTRLRASIPLPHSVVVN